MPFFDWLPADENSPSMLRPAPEGSLPVSSSQQGSILDQSDPKNRGKKRRIPIWKLRPLTAEDKTKLEVLSRGGDPTIEDLERFGVKYEVDPSDVIGRTGAGQPQEEMLQRPTDPRAAVQGTPMDLIRPIANLPGFNVEREMADREAKAKAEGERQTIEAKTKADVLKMQEQAKLEGEKPPAPEEVDRQRKDLADQAKAIERKRALTGDDGTPGKDNIFEPFNALAPNGKREFVTQATKVLRKINEHIPGLDPMSRISFWAAMPAYAEALGEQAFGRVVGPLAQDDKELAQIRKGYQELKGKAEAEGQAANEDRRMQLEERKRIMTELANDDVMNTPLGITAFILLSLIIGPQMSAFIMTRSKNRGLLQAQLQEANVGIKDARERLDRARQMQNRVGFESLDAEGKFGLQRQEAGERTAGRALEHRYRMHELEAHYKAQQALQGGNAKKDPAREAFLEGMKNQQRVLAISEKEIEGLQKEVDNWSGKAAQAVDGTLRQDFKNRWQQAETRLKAAIAKANQAEEALKKMYAHWNELYGNAPSEEPATADTGGE